MSVRLDRDEAWRVVEGAHTGILTTLRADGVPISLPVWFVVLDRRVYVKGVARSKRHARVRRDPRAAFLVESGERWAELKAVHLTGRAGIVTERALLERIDSELEKKYRGFRTRRAAMPDATRRHYSDATNTIEIVPDERILSWDNSRLTLRP
jgi:nitroimidazol reductase NimA-like FMN-containing flavoprotein (pyridoxamine 5'-phosphate oxidase superfamily)